VGVRVCGHRLPACLRWSLSFGVLPVSLGRSPVLSQCALSSHYEVERAENVITSSGNGEVRRGRRAGDWPASGLRTSWFAWCYEGAPAVDGDDDPALAQQRHCVPDGGVGDPVFLGEAPLAGEFPRDLALGDPPLHVVRDLDIGIFSPKGINRTRGHKINLGCSPSCQNTS
jgi:hypothetical protein